MASNKYGRSRKEVFEKDLEDFAGLPENKGKGLKATDYLSWARRNERTSLDTLSRCYGNWEEALKSIQAKSFKSSGISDLKLLSYFEDCWEWDSDGSFDNDLCPTANTLVAYGKKTGESITQNYFEKRGWVWGEFKRLMKKYKAGEISLEEVINSKKTKNLEEPISSKTRHSVLERDKGICQLCGVSASDGFKMHIDHIHPRSKGGSSTDLENLRTLCSNCNLGKGSKII